MTFDAERGVAVLFGGWDELLFPQDETWEWDGATWQLRATPTFPAARADTAIVFDTRRRVSLLFGGTIRSFTPVGDLWQWDGNGWAEQRA